jgi:subtilase family serine protease
VWYLTEIDQYRFLEPKTGAVTSKSSLGLIVGIVVAAVVVVGAAAWFVVRRRRRPSVEEL